MKILNYVSIVVLTTCALSANAASKETVAASSYGQHLAFEKACKGVEGVSFKSKDKKEVLAQHLSEGGKKAEFTNVVSTFTKATEKNLSQLDNSDLAKTCKEYSAV